MSYSIVEVLLAFLFERGCVLDAYDHGVLGLVVVLKTSQVTLVEPLLFLRHVSLHHDRLVHLDLLCQLLRVLNLRLFLHVFDVLIHNSVFFRLSV